jgi:hypothetical protein
MQTSMVTLQKIVGVSRLQTTRITLETRTEGNDATINPMNLLVHPERRLPELEFQQADASMLTSLHSIMNATVGLFDLLVLNVHAQNASGNMAFAVIGFQMTLTNMQIWII